MYIEFHLIQNFVPSNLNRDDTGSPKDCVFGGFRRARISSQCAKKAIRDYPEFARGIEKLSGDIGIRTKRLVGELDRILSESERIKGLPEEERAKLSEQVAQNIVKCIGLGFPTDNNTEDHQEYGKTQYLLFLGKEEMNDLVEKATSDKYWPIMKSEMEVPLVDAKGKNKTAKKLKEDREKLFKDAELKAKLGDDSAKGLQTDFKSTVRKERIRKKAYAADIALFGRMIADDKNMNVDAACPVAHAVSTHEVEMKMDFFTAIDDLLPDDTSGSDMMGFVEYNSACFYRYALINLDILKRNMGCDGNKKSETYDPEIVKASVTGFLKGLMEAVPAGMQNSMAHFNPPSYVRVLVRNSGAPWNLANAFVQPVRAGRENGEDIINKSVKSLETYLDGLKTSFCDNGIVPEGDLVFSHGLAGRSGDLTDSKLREMLEQAISAEVAC